MRVYSQHNKRTTTTDRTRIGIPQYNTIKLDSGPLLTLSVTTVTNHQRGGVEKTIETPVIWNAVVLIITSRQCTQSPTTLFTNAIQN